MDRKILGQLATKQDLEKLVSNEGFSDFKNESFNRFDDVMVILKRLDQERVFSNERVNRIDDAVRTIQAEISKS